jgi:hypothetical protein
MIAFDTDVLTEILQGNDAFVIRAAAIPVQEQAIPIIVLRRDHPRKVKHHPASRGR